jgi:hypothetical protein
MTAGPVLRPWLRLMRISVRGLSAFVLLLGVWLGWLVRSAEIQRDAVTAIERAGGIVRYDWQIKSSQLTGLASLTLLELAGTHVSDAGLAHLNRLTSLVFLSLNGTQVSDAGLAQLKGLSNLSYLCLDKTQVSDAGLAQLSGLTKLSRLNLHGTVVTDSGMKKLRQVLPNLTISR